MKRWSALIVLTGVAATATAEISHIDLRMRVWGSSDPWSDTLAIEAPSLGDLIEVEVAAFYVRSSGYGMSTCVHSIVGAPFNPGTDAVTLLDRADSSQHPDGRVGNFNFGAQRQFLYHAGTSVNPADANRFRIAAAGNVNDLAAGGISIKQDLPGSLGTSFDVSNPAFGYHFKLTLAAANNGAPRTMVIDAPIAKINTFRVYDNSTSTTATDSPFSASDPATITVSWLPAPGSSAMIGVGAWLFLRRRR